MYYLIETNEQLNRFINKNFKKVFIEPIYLNDHIHPKLNSLSLLYIRPIEDIKGYIIGIDHSESLNEELDLNKLINSFEEIYVLDRKSFLYFYPLNKVIDIGYINNFSITKTPTHEKFNKLTNINYNTIIPIVKHYEYLQNLYKQITIPNNLNRYQQRLTSTFFYIENNGILINKNKFDEYYDPNDVSFSIQHNTVYTNYNLYTTTGRPSNAFNGINFAALKKDDGSRSALVPKNDYFIEIDINAYHPTLLGKLINFSFGEENPYEYFSKEANIELKLAKVEFIKQMYGGVYSKYKNIPFFSHMSKYLDGVWEEFNTNGKITSPSGNIFFKNKLEDMTPGKLLSYFIQSYETYNNVGLIWDMIKILKNKQTQIILYTYDSFLFDVLDEEAMLFKDIFNIFKENKLKIKISKGKNYGEMELIKK